MQIAYSLNNEKYKNILIYNRCQIYTCKWNSMVINFKHIDAFLGHPDAIRKKWEQWDNTCIHIHNSNNDI